MGGTVDVVSAARHHGPMAPQCWAGCSLRPQCQRPSQSSPRPRVPQACAGRLPMGSPPPGRLAPDWPHTSSGCLACFSSFTERKSRDVRVLPGHPSGNEPHSVLSGFFLPSFCFNLGFSLIFLAHFLISCVFRSSAASESRAGTDCRFSARAHTQTHAQCQKQRQARPCASGLAPALHLQATFSVRLTFFAVITCYLFNQKRCHFNNNNTLTNEHLWVC